MKTLLLRICVGAALVCISYQINAQTWLWARQSGGGGAGSENFQEGFSAACDNAGNVYVAGLFYCDSITFGSATLKNRNNGSSDFYIVKYDASGNLKWLKGGGGQSYDDCLSIAVDSHGNPCITGVFYSDTLWVGSNFTLRDGSTSNVFVIKFDSSGNLLWSKTGTGDMFCYSSSITVDPDGNIYITGTYGSAPISFGPYTLNYIGDQGQTYIVKYNIAGNEQWATSIMGGIVGNSIAVDANASIYITGYFYADSIILGSHVIHNIVNGGGGYSIPFIAKFNSNGIAQWAKSPDGIDSISNGSAPFYNIGTHVSVDGQGNSYVAGYFGLASINFGNFALFNAGIWAAFIVKYDSSGNVLWAKGSVGDSIDYGWCVAADAFGNVYLSGGYTSSTMSIANQVFTFPVGAWDPMYIIKFNSAGKVECSAALPSGGDDQNGIIPDNFGNIYFTSDFAFVDPFILGDDTLYATCLENVFIGKWMCDFEGIPEINNDKLISLYPNPVQTQLTIDLITPANQPTIRVYDLQGRMIALPTTFTNTQAQLNTEKLPDGFYTLQIINTKTGEHSEAKFVKQ